MEKMFLKISQNSQGDTCAEVSFSLKLPAILLKKRIQHRCFPVNFVKFIRTLFYRIPTAAASVNQQPKLKLNPQHGNLDIFQKLVLREKYPNTEFFLVRIFPHSDQKKLRIWTLFTQ